MKANICIVGGGLVGGTLAWVLSRAGYRICLIDAHTQNNNATKDIYAERSIALSYGSKVLLQQMGLWESLHNSAVSIDHIHISESGKFGATRLHAVEEGVESLGYVIRNSAFMGVLTEKLCAQSNIVNMSPTEVIHIDQSKDQTTIHIARNDEKSSIQTDVVLAADGSNSIIAKLLGIAQRESPYEQAAIVANIRCEKDHQNVAYERFTDSGPLALLPLDEKIMAMVYTVEKVDMPIVLGKNDQQIMQIIQEKFGFRLGRFEKIGKRIGFPLSLVESEQQYSGRALLMGNSARTLHPVSGQGFNLALRDIALLAELLLDMKLLGKIPSENTFKSFVEQRSNDQKRVVRFTDGLVKVFRGKAPLFSNIRAGGLIAVDIIPPLKSLLVKQSTGMTQRLPNLSRLN